VGVGSDYEQEKPKGKKMLNNVDKSHNAFLIARATQH